MSVNWDPPMVPNQQEPDSYCPICDDKAWADTMGYSLHFKMEVCESCLEEQCVVCTEIIDEAAGDSWWFDHATDGPYCDACAVERAKQETSPQELTPPSVV